MTSQDIKLQLPQYLKNIRTPPPISFSIDTMVGKKPDEKQDSLKVKIKTQPGETNSKAVLLYVPIINIWSTKAMLKLLILPNNILRGKNLKTVPHCNYIINNILTGEALWFFEQKAWEKGNKTTTNYDLVMQGMNTHFFLPNALQYQKGTYFGASLRPSALRYKNSSVEWKRPLSILVTFLYLVCLKEFQTKKYWACHVYTFLWVSETANHTCIWLRIQDYQQDCRVLQETWCGQLNISI